MLSSALLGMDKPSPAPDFILLESVFINGQIARIMGYVFECGRWWYWTNTATKAFVFEEITPNQYRKAFTPRLIKFRRKLGDYVLFCGRPGKIVGNRYFDNDWHYCVQLTTEAWAYLKDCDLKDFE